MAGHSKWAQIKRQKGANDAKRGQLFTKLGREITVASREGGGDPNGNVRLRLAIQRARESNMPMENIERAIKRGTGQIEGAAYEEMTYEGYGPGGAALMVEVMTDNRNRTAAELRNVLTHGGGNLGESGSVAWQFQRRGVISIDADGRDPDEVALVAIDAGAEDVQTDDGHLEVYTEPEGFEAVRQALETAGVPIENAEVAMVPTAAVDLDEATSLKVMRLIEKLEDLDDVQSVVTNANFAESAMASVAG